MRKNYYFYACSYQKYFLIFDRVNDFVKKYNISFVEDAEALGSKFKKDQSSGTFGRKQIRFSVLMGNKIISTGGGGVIVTNDKILF